MKLCYCDWMPSSVAAWLSETLESKGIHQQTQALILLLHPRFCSATSSLGFSDEFEESVHPDADFPTSAAEFLKISEIAKSTASVDLDPTSDLKWKNKAFVYLSAYYDQPEELKQLIEDLFQLLHKSKLTKKPNIHCPIDDLEVDIQSDKGESAELCESLKKALKRTPQFFGLDNNKNECTDQGYKETIANKSLETGSVETAKMDEDNNIIMDNFNKETDDMLSQKVASSVECKEGWECISQLGGLSKSNATDNFQGSSLFEWSTNEWKNVPGDPPDEMEPSKLEPWETKPSVWKMDSASEKKIHLPESMENSFSSVSVVEHPHQDVFEAAAPSSLNVDSFVPWNINQDVQLNYERNQRGIWASNFNLPSDTASQPASLQPDRNIEDQLFQSLQHLGIHDLWESGTTHDGTSDLSLEQIPESTASRIGFNSVVDKPSPEVMPNIHFGPSGQHVDLNHVETSGFSPVVPHKDDLVAKVYAAGLAKKGETPSTKDKNTEEENLLTSPRTHFRPIRHDSQCTPTEDDESPDDGLIPLPESDAQSHEVFFHRSGSGNLLLESDAKEGSPEKYMVFKETPEDNHASSVSPEFNSSLHQSIAKQESPALVPKFKVVNNEKFCQTEDQSQDAEASFLPSIWQNQFPPDIKNIWEMSGKSTGKEIWEVDFNHLDDLRKQWSDGLNSKRDDASQDDELLSKVWNMQPKMDPINLDLPDTFMNLDSSNGNLWENSLRKNRCGDLDRASEASKPWSPKEFIPLAAKTSEKKSSKWSFDWGMDDEPFGLEPSKKAEMKAREQLRTISPTDGQFDDLNNLGFEFKGGFEWEHSNEDENEEENSQDMIPVETEDGQTVFVPIQYLDNELYDSLFDTDSEASASGSLPSLPPDELEKWKKKMSAKLAKRGRAAKSLPPSRRPCSFFLEGNCRRTDCKFSHDLSSITCRFWEEEGCLKGDMCPFYHGYTVNPRRRNRSEGDQATEPITIFDQNGRFGKRGRKCHSFELNLEADFPTLGSSYESRATSTEELSMAEIISKAPRTKKKKKSKGTRKDTLPTGPMSDPIVVPSEGNDSKEGLPSKDKNNEKRPKRSSKRLATSLRKVLKTHQDLLSKQSYRCHEDGTVSDF